MYARDKMEQLQTKFDEFEAIREIRRPEDLGVVH